ncbi:hypothetical protein C672_3599 [[Clostridium] bifermentans ATCC 638]|uniref:Uncharacterized protein n=1 Tax=Paraclostridium bifermentans ATCC 638 = DSM 14991 TaxID=1233171 RepID=T4VF84_PARBF|nr:hypothetical protein [Paraclostridium bifermentans]EQK39775.1 hypothetical protein C672_3599 [[Clostridium] bifermentans ATCC 638] [Paraclostridium bifermentans ATCC 638 = DSM 14991]
MDNNFTDEIYKTFEKFAFEEVSYTNLDLVVSSVKEIFDRYKKYN